MFDILKNRKEGFKKEIEDLKEKVISSDNGLFEVRKELREAKDELERVRSVKLVEEEKIKHMIKMKEEKNSLQLEKGKLEMEREGFAKIEKIKDEYRDKLEGFLQSQIKDVKDSHDKLMKHMPKIEAMFSNQKPAK